MTVSLLHSLSEEDKDFLAVTLCLLHFTMTAIAMTIDSNRMQPRMGRSNANTMFSAKQKIEPEVVDMMFVFDWMYVMHDGDREQNRGHLNSMEKDSFRDKSLTKELAIVGRFCLVFFNYDLQTNA